MRKTKTGNLRGVGAQQTKQLTRAGISGELPRKLPVQRAGRARW